MLNGPYLMNFATSGFGFLVTILVILAVLQAAYFVISGGLKGTRFYYQARIHHDNPSIRAATIRELATRGSAMAQEFLLLAINDTEASNRLMAIEGLRRYSEPRVQEALVRVSTDAHPVVRRAAVSALGRFQSPEAVDALVKRLHDTVPAVQIAAINGLKVAQDPATIEALGRVLSSSDKDVVRHAQEALLPFGLPVIDRLGAMLVEVGSAAPALIRVMYQLDRELACQAIAQVLPEMRNPQAIAEAVTLLVRHNQPGLVTLFAQLLDLPDFPSQDLIIHSFVKLHDPDAIAPLCHHLRTARFRPSVVATLESLAPVFGRELIGPLSVAIKDKDRAVRKAAANLLGHVGGTLMVDAGLAMLWGEKAAEHRAFLERHLGYSLHRLATYHEAALSLDRLMTNMAGEEGLQAIDELVSLLILLYGESIRAVVTNERAQLILRERRTLYPVRLDRLNPLASDLLEFAANMVEGDRFRMAAP